MNRLIIGFLSAVLVVPCMAQGPEAYILKVPPKGVTIKAGGEPGLFYARQTLR